MKVRQRIILVSFIAFFFPAHSQKDSNQLNPRSYLSINGGLITRSLEQPDASKGYYIGTTDIHNNNSFGAGITGEFMIPHSDIGVIGTARYQRWTDTTATFNLYSAMGGIAYAIVLNSHITMDFKTQLGFAYSVIPGNTNTGLAFEGVSYGPLANEYSSTSAMQTADTKSVPVYAFIFNLGMDMRVTVGKAICLLINLDYMNAVFRYTQNTQYTTYYTVTSVYNGVGGNYTTTNYNNPPSISETQFNYILNLHDIGLTLGLGYQFGR